MKIVLVIVSLALAAQSAVAALKPTYMVDGKVVTPETALRAALANQNVVACKEVEAVVSKTGSSIGLRQKKGEK